MYNIVISYIYFITCTADCTLVCFCTQEIRPSTGGGGDGGGASTQKGFGVLIVLLGMITIAFY